VVDAAATIGEAGHHETCHRQQWHFQNKLENAVIRAEVRP